MLVAISTLMTSTSLVLAEEPLGEEPIEAVAPAGDEGFGSRDKFNGPTSSTETESRCGSEGEASVATSSTIVSAGGGPAPCPKFAIVVTTTKYYVDSIYGRYDGYYDYSTQWGCIGPCTAAATWSTSVSNKWGASIKFDKAPISATVGYDVTFTESRSYTFSFAVASGREGLIRYKNWYHVTKMYVHKNVCQLTCTRYDGTAWAGDFFKRVFYLKYT